LQAMELDETPVVSYHPPHYRY